MRCKNADIACYLCGAAHPGDVCCKCGRSTVFPPSEGDEYGFCHRCFEAWVATLVAREGEEGER